MGIAMSFIANKNQETALVVFTMYYYETWLDQIMMLNISILYEEEIPKRLIMYKGVFYP
jgi:hypothetical protein